MEVKPGYKQTEVGVIPEAWGITSLGELVDQSRKITYGIVVPGPETHNGIPMIRAQDYSKGWVDLEDLYRVSHTIDKGYKRSKVIAGDVLLTIVGSVGNLAKVPRTFDGSNITQQTARLSFNPNVADADYYFNALLSDVGRKAIANFTKSGVQPSLNLSDVEKFILPQPPLHEQRAIATALSDVDALLVALHQLIAKKRDLKQAAMQQLLTGQTRLPGFHGEWESVELKAIYAKVFKKSPISSADGSAQGTYPLFVSGGEAKRTDQALFKDADALIVSDGGVFDVKYFFGSFSVTDHCFVVSVKGDMRFYFQWMTLRKQALDLMTFKGSGLRNLDKSAFGKVEVPLPPVPEQIAIAEVLTEMDAELAALEQRRDKTRDLKQAMMQELLTGRIRLI